ncbi:MAG: phytase [Bacteroidales bacterium]
MNSRSVIVTVTVLTLTLLMQSCNRPDRMSRKAGEHITTVVQASAETDPTMQGKNVDSADDPAIWINRENIENSVIIGTDKKGGLATYNLAGKQLNYYPTGYMNNCDLRYGFKLGNKTIDILAASNRTFNSVSLFSININGELDSIHNRIIKSQMTGEVYGLCMYKETETEKYYVFLNSKSGEVEQYELFAAENKVDAKLVRSFSLGMQSEGMVADDITGTLYIGKEQAGILKFDANPGETAEGNILQNSSEENNNIRFDIEGLAIYPTDSLNGYLIASIQGNNSYAVFERQGNNKYLGSFRITDGNIDGVQETDGLDVTASPLPGFPKGILVVQDGFNYENHRKKSQNYKIVSCEEFEEFFREYR